MVALTIVSGEPTTTDLTAKKIAQVVIADGRLIFEDSANLNKANLGDMDAATTDNIIGMTLNGGGAGQEIIYAKPKSTVNVTTVSFAVGLDYYLGNGGNIVPLADVVSGKYKVYVGHGITTTSLWFEPIVYGIAVP